jgi:hypothetical protein
VTARCEAHADRSAALEALLESVQRERLSPLDLRVLLRVTDGEVTIGELADSMGQPPDVLRRATTRLAARGLLRDRPRQCRRLELTLTATAAGISALHRVSGSLCRTSPSEFSEPTATLASVR